MGTAAVNRYHEEGLPNFVFRADEGAPDSPPLDPYEWAYAMNTAPAGTPANNPASYDPIGTGFWSTPSIDKYAESGFNRRSAPSNPLLLVTSQGEANPRGWIGGAGRRAGAQLLNRVHSIENADADGNRLKLPNPDGGVYESHNPYVWVIQPISTFNFQKILCEFNVGADKLLDLVVEHAPKAFEAWRTGNMAEVARLQKQIETMDVPELRATWGYYFHDSTFIKDDSRMGGGIPGAGGGGGKAYYNEMDDLQFPTKEALAFRPRMFVSQGLPRMVSALTAHRHRRMVALVPYCMEKAKKMVEWTEEFIAKSSKYILNDDAVEFDGMSNADKLAAQTKERTDSYDVMMETYRKYAAEIDPLAVLMDDQYFVDSEGQFTPVPAAAAKAKRLLDEDMYEENPAPSAKRSKPSGPVPMSMPISASAKGKQPATTLSAEDEDEGEPLAASVGLDSGKARAPSSFSSSF